MADKDITVGIKTTADTAGADRTVAAIDKVADSTKRVSASQQDLRAEFAGMSERFDATQTAYYDLNRIQLKTAQSTETFNAGVTKLKAGTTDAGRSLLLFSQGFEDAQYGIRGVLNNIPGLVVALGGGAGLAGALSIAAVGFSILFESMSKTEEKADDVAESIRGIADAMGENEGDRFQAVSDAMVADKERADALKQSWDLTHQAEADYAAASLTNAEKLAQTQRNIAEALGLQVDHFKELEGRAAREAKAREVQAQQQRNQQDQVVAKAAEEVTKAADVLAAATNQQAVEEARLLTLRAQLQALRDQRKAWEEMAKPPATFSPDDPLAEPDPARLRQQSEAKRQLANPAFQAELQGTQKQVDQLEADIRALADVNKGAVVKADNALTETKVKLEDAIKARSIKLEEINNTVAIATDLAKSEDVLNSSKTLATGLQETFSVLRTNTVQTEQARQAILAAAADGKITAEEMVGLAQNLQTMAGLLQSGLASSSQNLQTVITTITQFQSEQQRQARVLEAINARQNQK